MAGCLRQLFLVVSHMKLNFAYRNINVCVFIKYTLINNKQFNSTGIAQCLSIWINVPLDRIICDAMLSHRQLFPLQLRTVLAWLRLFHLATLCVSYRSFYFRCYCLLFHCPIPLNDNRLGFSVTTCIWKIHMLTSKLQLLALNKGHVHVILWKNQMDRPLGKSVERNETGSENFHF